jgi:acyl-coenzyme A synthetase/AMP-(fatty) acid ligase
MNMTNYEETKRTFALDVPFGFNFTRDVVDAWAKREPDKVALVRVDANGENREELTFTDISRLANRVGNAFQALGLQPGDRAFIMSHRIPQWWGLLCGMFKIGLVPMPATTLCTARDIEYRVNKAAASALIVDVDGLAKAEEVRDKLPSVKHWICINSSEPGWTSLDDLVGRASDAEPAPRETKSSDPLLLYFTSGTVAYPKMVQHTHASYGFGHEITGRFWQDLVPTDSQFTISDTVWAKAAWGCLFPQWRLGASVFIWDQRGKMDPTLCLRVLEESGATVFCAPPTLYRAFAQLPLHEANLSSVRHSIGAGEPLNPEIIKIWKDATGTIIHDGYGQTETTNLVANYPCMEVRPGSMGRPCPGVEVDIVDDGGDRCGVGEEGVISVQISPQRPVNLMTGYWRDDDATAKAMRNGWYYTGDRATRDEDGYIWFVGRDDDVITSSAYRIGPFEIESALVEHPAVAESAVVGKADPERTQIVKAYVVLAAGYAGSEALVSELQDHVKKVTAPYKYPREIEFVAELPKTISGKIRRADLRRKS